MKIEIEVTGDNPFILSEFYKLIKNYLKCKAATEGLKINIERK